MYIFFQWQNIAYLFTHLFLPVLVLFYQLKGDWIYNFCIIGFADDPWNSAFGFYINGRLKFVNKNVLNMNIKYELNMNMNILLMYANSGMQLDTLYGTIKVNFLDLLMQCKIFPTSIFFMLFHFFLFVQATMLWKI